MKNIYEIEQNLQALLNEIEDNGGELTPEQEEQLNIASKDFTDKMQSYSHAVTLINKDVDCIKDEIYRLIKLAEGKNKIIERLKSVMCNAVIKFGNCSKTGVYSLDLGTCKFSTRRVESVTDNYKDIYDYIAESIRLIGNRAAHDNDGSFESINQDYIINAIENTYNTVTNNSILLKSDDLNDVNVELSVTIPGSDLGTMNNNYLLAQLGKYLTFKVKSKLNKTEVKSKIKNTGYCSNLGTLETKYSLQIK